MNIETDAFFSLIDSLVLAQIIMLQHNKVQTLSHHNLHWLSRPGHNLVLLLGAELSVGHLLNTASFSDGEAVQFHNSETAHSRTSRELGSI